MSFRIWPGRGAPAQQQTPVQRLEALHQCLMEVTRTGTLTDRSARRIFKASGPVLQECEEPRALLSMINGMVTPLKVTNSRARTELLTKLSAIVTGREQLDEFKAKFLTKPEPEVALDLLEAPKPPPDVMLS